MSNKTSILNIIYFDNVYGWAFKPSIGIDNLGGIRLETAYLDNFNIPFNNGNTGPINIETGYTTVDVANYAAAGSVNIIAGDWYGTHVNSSGEAGSIMIKAGYFDDSVTNSSPSGGTLNLMTQTDGAYIGLTSAGRIAMVAGQGYNNGGYYTFTAANSNINNNNGGGYTFTAGNSTANTSIGGGFLVNCGEGDETKSDNGAGSVEFFAGRVQGGGLGGSISIYGSNITDSTGSGNPALDKGGNIRIKAGDGYKTNGTNYPYGKTVSGTADGGSVFIGAGDSYIETPGDVNIISGKSFGGTYYTAGKINITGADGVTGGGGFIAGGDINLTGGGVDGNPTLPIDMTPGNITLSGGNKKSLGLSGGPPYYADGYRDGYVKLDSKNNATRFRGGMNFQTTIPVSYPYTAVKGDYTILVDSSGGPVTVNLPADGSFSALDVGDVIVIKDDAGNAGTNNITVDANGSTIEGNSTETIGSAFGILQVIFTGTEWKTFGGGGIQLTNDLGGTASAPEVHQISGNSGSLNIAADTWMFYKDKFPYIYLEDQDDGEDGNEITIQGQNSSNNNGNGGHIKLLAGHATAGTGNDAGDVWVFAGDIQGSATGNPGQIILTAGNADSADAGGSAFLEAGYSMLGDGGLIQIAGGDAFASTKTGGSVSIISGGSISAGVNSGNISISSKVAHNNTGTISIFSSNTANGNSGAISLTSGTANASTKSSGALSFISGSSTSGSSGSIQITTGNASTATGSISITTGNASGGNASGVTVTAGNGNSGGAINVTAGNSTNSGGASGSMAFTSGDATAGNVNGGNINFNLGTGFGTGVRGAFSVNSASAIVLDGNVGLARGLNQTSSTIGTNTTLSSATNALYSLYLVAAGVTLTLPATPLLGTTLTVSDYQGGAAGSNVIIAGNGFNINGSSSYTINTNYGAATVHFTGSVWVVISKA